MRAVWMFLLLAGPAAAHHESVAVTVVPGLALWALAVGTTALAFWRKRQRRRRTSSR